jgi:hypothetical protein
MPVPLRVREFTCGVCMVPETSADKVARFTFVPPAEKTDPHNDADPHQHGQDGHQDPLHAFPSPGDFRDDNIMNVIHRFSLLSTVPIMCWRNRRSRKEPGERSVIL